MKMFRMLQSFFVMVVVAAVFACSLNAMNAPAYKRGEKPGNCCIMTYYNPGGSVADRYIEPLNEAVKSRRDKGKKIGVKVEQRNITFGLTHDNHTNPDSIMHEVEQIVSAIDAASREGFSDICFFTFGIARPIVALATHYLAVLRTKDEALREQTKDTIQLLARAFNGETITCHFDEDSHIIKHALSHKNAGRQALGVTVYMADTALHQLRDLEDRMSGINLSGHSTINDRSMSFKSSAHRVGLRQPLYDAVSRRSSTQSAPFALGSSESGAEQHSSTQASNSGRHGELVAAEDRHDDDSSEDDASDESSTEGLVKAFVGWMTGRSDRANEDFAHVHIHVLDGAHNFLSNFKIPFNTTAATVYESDLVPPHGVLTGCSICCKTAFDHLLRTHIKAALDSAVKVIIARGLEVLEEAVQ